MAKITYLAANGEQHTVDVANGVSVMEGAKSNNVPGIDADCGGACACGTCHVYVDAPFFDALKAPTNMEKSMLSFSEQLQANSRLACQITVSDALDGMLVRTPERQQ